MWMVVVSGRRAYRAACQYPDPRLLALTVLNLDFTIESPS